MVLKTDGYLEPNATLAVIFATPDKKTLFIPESPPAPDQLTEGRIVYIKGTQNLGTSYLFDVTCSTNVTFYPNFTTKADITPFQCMTLLEYPANKYNILSYYQATYSDYVSSPAPGSIAINVSPTNSIIFVDLTSQSKALILPSIESLVENSNQSPYFLIKDVNGYAGTNYLYISTSGVGETFDSRPFTIRMTTSFSAIEIAAEPRQNRWNILSFF